MKYEQNKDLKKHRRNRFNGPVWEGCTAPSQDSGRGDARFELVFNLCTDMGDFNVKYDGCVMSKL